MGKKLMNKYFKTIFIILILLATSACQSSKLDIYGMPKPPKEGPQEYITGWTDGCKTGMTSYGSYYLKAKYQVNVKPNMMRDFRYNKGWELSQRYCSYYISTYLSNNELTDYKVRSDNTLFSLQSDGFFEYSW